MCLVDSGTNVLNSFALILFMGAFSFALCKREKQTKKDVIKVANVFNKDDMKNLTRLKKQFVKTNWHIKNLYEELKDVENRQFLIPALDRLF
jgi:sialic acid synthase SpsE